MSCSTCNTLKTLADELDYELQECRNHHEVLRRKSKSLQAVFAAALDVSLSSLAFDHGMTCIPPEKLHKMAAALAVAAVDQPYDDLRGLVIGV